ncbi:MAG: hypothetical protein JWM21_3481 [Acidobacteria bacterium]|nr:hypothetical protein [Acidobacteriota bacterium]
MKTLTFLVRQSSLTLCVVLFSVLATTAQTLTFNYQGKLPDEYNQPTGSFDFQFNLYDEVNGTNAPLNATPIVLEDVAVINGMFSVSLNFGSLFSNGADRYLEIGVRPGDSTGAFTTLDPRKQVTSAPYTIRSLSAATADAATNAENLGGTSSSDFVQTTDPRLTDPRLPIPGSNDYIQNTTSVQSAANFNIDGTGTANVLNALTQFNIGGNRALSVAGEGNIFAGLDSGHSNTNGNNNSFFGSGAGQTNNTGFRNSFFGSGAGSSTGTGHNNVFLGGSAGATNTSGSFNVFIGESAFVNNTGFNFAGTSSYNTFVGAISQVTPGNALFFASAIGARSVATASDTIVLGKIAGVYDGVSRPADTVQIPGSLQVTGSVTASNFNGAALTNINASNITTGTLDNARLNVIPISKGGTGLTSVGANGSFLRSNGTAFTSSALQVGDVPDLSASYIRNQTGSAQSGGFNLSGNGTATVFNATTQFNIAGTRVLSVSGTNNTFTGVNAGTANVTGADNAFFGSDAGRVNTSGTDNAFFGVQSGRQNTSGGNNSFFGVNTGYGNTSGHSNSFVGMQAGQSNTAGHNNSLFGYIAGINNATGNFNSVFGSNANVGSDNLSYAGAIGSGALVNASDTIVLGKVAGIYDGVSRSADTVQVPGNLNVVGTISGNIDGANLTNLNASNITTGTLADSRLSSNIATLSGAQTFTGAKTFANGINGDGSGLTGLNANNITSGTLDNARLGIVGVANGGTGLTTVGASGNFLRSNGAGFTSSALAATDIPAGNTNYIQNTTTPQTGANFNVSGNGVVGGDLSVSGSLNASGSGLTNLNAANLTSGTLDNARLGSIPTANIADSAITAPKIGGSAVTTTKIADSAVTAAKIASNEVVKNLNGLTDNVTLAAGDNVTITPAGNTLTIATNGGNFIQNSTTQQPGSNFNITGNGLAANLTASGALSGSVVNTATYFNIDGNRVLSQLGSNNIFVGYQAGLNNTTGDRNAFFGITAGRNNILGHTNSFVGFQAGYNNTSNSNAFYGAYTGLANTEGYYNAFFGTSAGYSNTTAGNNSFFGTNAGFTNTTGYGNLFLGSFTGYYTTTGYNNSFVGTNSGLANTTGIANTLLGANSNVAANNLYFATAIGSEATVSTSNTIVLGRTAGQDTVQIPGSVGIGTSTPNAQLHIMTPSTSGDALRLQRNVNTNGWGVAQYFGLKNSSSGATDYAAITGSIMNNTAGSESGAMAFYTRNAGTLTEQARLDNNGNLGIGTTSPTAKLHVAGTTTVDGILKLNALGTAGGSSLCRNSSNQVAACSSSLRYKTNVAPFTFGLSLVRRLRPIRFAWKDGGMKDLGFGAEDVAGVEPLLVTYNASGQVEGVKYDRISAVLVNAVNEQQTQIEKQQTRLELQQAQIKAQQAQINQQQVLIDGLKKVLCRQNSRDPVCQ